MAVLKGKGSMTGVNLIARVYDNGGTKDGKTHYADVQVDARDSRGPGQSNLHLKSERVTTPDGKSGFNNGAPYSVGQMEEIVKAAGPNKERFTNEAGEEVGTVYGFKGNVMPASRGTGLVVNTKTVGPSEFKVEPNTLDNQYKAMEAVAAQRKTEKAAAPQVENQAEATEPAPEVDEPAVG